MTNTINKIFKGDRTIIIIVIVLVLFSALLMGSTLTKMALDNNEFSFYYLIRQLFFSAVAVVFMIVISHIPYQLFSKIAKSLLIIAGILTLITLLFGIEINDSKRWLKIFGVQFQTSDFVKLAVIIYTAKIISEFDFLKDDVNALLKKILIPALTIVVLSARHDLSTAALLYISVFTMIFITPINKKYFFKIFAIISAAGIVLFLFVALTGVMKGNTWKNRFSSPEGYNQSMQAKIAISNGGLLIKPGKSQQKFVLANSYSDYIFSIAAEEYGIWGVTLLIGFFLIFMYRIMQILKRQKRSFPMFLALGIAINILFQAFMHITVNVGLFPVTGQPLPLISHGGTSIIISAFQIGIILNISQNRTTTEKPKPIIDEINATEEEIESIEIDTEMQEPEIEIDDYPFLVG